MRYENIKKHMAISQKEFKYNSYYKRQKIIFKNIFLPDHMRDGKIVDDAFGEVEAHEQVDTLSNDA